MILIIFNFISVVSCPRMSSVTVNVPCDLEKKVPSAVGWSTSVRQMRMLVVSSFSFPEIFGQVLLSVEERNLLELPTVMVDFSISSCSFISFHITYLRSIFYALIGLLGIPRGWKS